ncbi:MAG TPA: tRNA dihydrouridine synthase DusB [Thermodesulfovibrionales bacterium]|jgi:nifR3 family TIM-barrel protein|nr:tRNA dihydrouridine synthase DusB [Thermodesulfovibrionales bacterium]
MALPVKLGSLAVSPLILAPMAGITDLPFRLISRSFGCGLAFVEMISARALVYRNRNTERMLATAPSDRPLGIQLLGNAPDVIKRALDIVRTYRFDMIDFNAACPASKVTGKGKGAGLLKDPARLRDLLKVIVDNSDAPVTVKIRTGWDETSINARDVALYAQDAGISALFIHGRTRSQRYSGRVDYGVIREVKEALKIPVIASGDAFSPLLVERMFRETACDGVAIARGALGNPWIFRETEEYLERRVAPERPDIGEIAETMVRHLDLCTDFYGERVGTILFRKFFAWYTKGISDMKPLRDKAFRAETREQMVANIREFRERASSSDDPSGTKKEAAIEWQAS